MYDDNSTRPSSSNAVALWVSGLLLLTLSTSTACMTRVLSMPTSQAVPSKAGQIVEMAPISDERAGVVLGEVDSVTIESREDLLVYIAGELANGLSRMGLDVREVDANASLTDRRRIRGTLLSAEVSSESSLMYPVVAAVRMRIELVDATQQLDFRKEIRGAVSRELGFHTQGGPENAQLLAEAVRQAVSSLEVDQSFVAALRGSDHKTPTVASDEGPVHESVADRLGTLDRLRDEGLIKQDEYQRKRGEILDDL
jgi:hypothetical protein